MSAPSRFDALLATMRRRQEGLDAAMKQLPSAQRRCVDALDAWLTEHPPCSGSLAQGVVQWDKEGMDLLSRLLDRPITADDLEQDLECMGPGVAEIGWIRWATPEITADALARVADSPFEVVRAFGVACLPLLEEFEPPLS